MRHALHIFVVLGLMLAVTLASSRPTLAQQQNAPEPTQQQLELQISIMKDYIKKLTANTGQNAANADLQNAYIEAKKKEYAYQIAEMDINIAAYQTARIASNVILALVVLVVVAGISFAGFQLWKSVSIAGVQETSDLEISASKVRVTSSVVGVVVLFISLAFLYIYTTEIYGVTVIAAPAPQADAKSVK
jgi:hypothetical protein